MSHFRMSEENVTDLAVDFKALYLSELSTDPLIEKMSLFHMVAVVKIPANVEFGFGEVDTEISFMPGIDKLNSESYNTETLMHSG